MSSLAHLHDLDHTLGNPPNNFIDRHHPAVTRTTSFRQVVSRPRALNRSSVHSFPLSTPTNLRNYAIGGLEDVPKVVAALPKVLEELPKTVAGRA